MAAKIIPCTSIADEILTSIKEEVFEKNFNPTLSIYSNPYDPAGVKYVQNKVDAAERCGIKCSVYPTDAFEDIPSLLDAIRYDSANGIVVQIPVEDRFRPYSKDLKHSMSPWQDVDGLSPEGYLRFVPATAFGIIELLRWIANQEGRSETWPGKKITVVGRSSLVGRPVAENLIKLSNSTITVCNSFTSPEDLTAACSNADAVIVAVGKAGLIKPEMIKEGATLIDAGINPVEVNGKLRLVGDADPACLDKCSWMTKIGKQGSVGKLTVACLMANTLKAYKIVNQLQ